MVEQQRNESTRGKRSIALAAVATLLLLPLLLMAVACPVATYGAAFYLSQADRVSGTGGDQWFLGIVREGDFLPLASGTVFGEPVRLTGIPMQAAVSPESEELDLVRYDGRVILVRGHDGGGWIYSATIIVKAGSILSAVVRWALGLRA